MSEADIPLEVQDQPSRRRTLLRAVLLGFVLVALALFYGLGGAEHLSWEELERRRAALQQLTDEHPFLGPTLFVLLYATATSISIPLGPALSLIGGALFERFLGTLFVSVASTAGASVSFLLSRYLFRDFVERHWGPRLEAIQRGVERDGIYYLLALRLTPLVPYTLINLGLGLTRMPLRTFWWVSQLGMLPMTFLFVNAGAELRQVQSPRDILSPGLLVSLSLAALVPLLARWLGTRLRRKASRE